MYKAIYKCRLCGKIFPKQEINGKDMELLIFDVMHFGSTQGDIGANTVWKESSHNCPDGSFGIADFQGFKKSEG